MVTPPGLLTRSKWGAKMAKIMNARLLMLETASRIKLHQCPIIIQTHNSNYGGNNKWTTDSFFSIPEDFSITKQINEYKRRLIPECFEDDIKSAF